MPTRTHGESGLRTYRIWNGMKQRCNNPNNKRYANYGGRGIKVSPAWETYDGFVAEMGHAPSEMSIDRIDNDGDYCRENCRWIPMAQQAGNTSRTRYYKGKSVHEWADELGVTVKCVHARLALYGQPQLPDTARQPLVYEGKTAKEWAVELGTSYTTMRARFQRTGTPFTPRLNRKE